MTASHRKVVARYADGRLVKGYTFDFGPAQTRFHVFEQPSATGTSTQVLVRELKAVFFVRDFIGNPTRQDGQKFPTGEVARPHVEVRFRDGEVMVGVADSPATDSSGFLPHPRGRRIEQPARLRGRLGDSGRVPVAASCPREGRSGRAPCRPVRLGRPQRSAASEPLAQLAHAVDWAPARSGPSPLYGGHACTRSMRSSAGSGTPRRASSSTESRHTSGSRSTSSSRLILGGPHPVLVDTGFGEEDAAARGLRGYVSPAAMVARLGVRAAEIPTALVTHLHWDHWAGYRHFPGAEFCIQQDEVAFWTGPVARYDAYRMSAHPEALAELVRLNYAKRVRLVQGDREVLPGLRVHRIGGHTAELQTYRWRQQRVGSCSRPTRPTSTGTSSASSPSRSSRACRRCWPASRPSTPWRADATGSWRATTRRSRRASTRSSRGSSGSPDGWGGSSDGWRGSPDG